MTYLERDPLSEKTFMNLFRFSRRAAVAIVGLSLMAGCGETQSATLNAVPQRELTAQRAGKSWMLPEAKGEDLIYVVGGCGGSCVLSYPNGKLVGTIDGYQGFGYSANRSDASGNVFVSNDTEVVEFAHAETTLIATFTLPGKDAEGCSVDPTSNDLAVVFQGEVAVFKAGSGTPSVYDTGISPNYCGYDAVGNLFVDGLANGAPGLAELPSGGASFFQLSISQSVGFPGQLQWDGSYITYESGGANNKNTISQLAISGSVATVVGTTPVAGIRRRALQSWIYNGTIVIPYGNHGPYAKNVGVWRYPGGGKPEKIVYNFPGFPKRTIGFFGATVSVAK